MLYWIKVHLPQSLVLAKVPCVTYIFIQIHDNIDVAQVFKTQLRMDGCQRDHHFKTPKQLVVDNDMLSGQCGDGMRH